MMVVCALQDDSTEQRSLREGDFIAAMQIVFLGAEEKLSVIVLHQTKELLCIGTAHDGLYLTTASNPTLSSKTTRLPRQITGENVFSACFIDGYEKLSDVLVVSCGSQNLSKDRFKLSLWDANARTLLWRGSADALDAIVALPGIFGFASCTQREVTPVDSETTWRGWGQCEWASRVLVAAWKTQGQKRAKRQFLRC
ncbi:hypothetical protein TcBrA4_0074850 [Trypanosoma cruzi]|nr:hypothetical protein TcBrA4_0074850 [Trypanosoma cruzi]